MYVGLKVFHEVCIILYTNHLCILYLYYFLVVVHRGPHGRLAFFCLMCYPLKIKTLIIIIVIRRKVTKLSKVTEYSG